MEMLKELKLKDGKRISSNKTRIKTENDEKVYPSSTP